MINATAGMATELADVCIRVTAIAPGYIATDRVRALVGGDLPDDAATPEQVADAVWSLGGPSLDLDTEPTDNAAHEQRDDVAVFLSAALATDLSVAGEPVARIRFRSSAPSYDVFVRITDVFPDGRSLTVCDGIRRFGSGEHEDAQLPAVLP